VVRQLEVWRRSNEGEADSLEPCILCARARHGLAPRCPECNEPAAVLEELELTDDHGLRCCRCQRQFWSTPKTRDAILEATLRRDPACRGCPLEHSPNTDGCRSSVTFLNFFRNRVLLLERLDLDLDDYFRWQRGGPGSAMRTAVRQAFASHRRLVCEERDRQHGPAVAKVADLLFAADLFAAVVAAVEHLHSQGIAHLDLKPANVCVRFQGSQLEVKIIDLGLSDDPATLTYLRQAEGLLSLWTDYSAPEFRRPRSRPLEVSARFCGDLGELDWPAEHSSHDAPCPGDLLFCDERDPRRQRLRVVGIQPGRRSGLVIQARAEPEHRTWLGHADPQPVFGLEAGTQTTVVIFEKHCGYPADIFSLGMLLLAVLSGNPDVGDFRETLPAVQIELEEKLRNRPRLPGRALVHLLLDRPSKHLQIFHAYAQRLAAFGIGQPFADELLGLVLRATLRGDPQFYYLPNRGGVAREALRRLRDDLDAIRGGLRNTLTMAEALAVRERRLAVLDQLRARLQHQPTASGPLVRPKPEGRLVYATLDLGAASEEHRCNELDYLALACQLGSLLDRWEHELDHPQESSGPGRSWEFFMRYCRRLDLSPTVTRIFLNQHRQLVAEAERGAGPPPAEGRDQTLVWVEEFRSLAERLEEGLHFTAIFEEFLAIFKDRLLTPWNRALRVKRLLFFRRKAVRIPLTRPERAAIPEGYLGSALERLEMAVQKGVTARRQRAQDYAAALTKWRTWCTGRSWVEGMARLEADALVQRDWLEEANVAWDRDWAKAFGCLSEFWSQGQAILGCFDFLLTTHPTIEEVIARLTRDQREGLHTRAAQNAAAWLAQNWPAPSERAEALFALWELGVSCPKEMSAEDSSDPV
jgi:hypothetical protein